MAMYDLTNDFNYIIAVVMLIILRKRYDKSVIKAILYGFLTLAFGVFALENTQFIADTVLGLVSNGKYVPAEKDSSFGYFLNMTPLYLIFCSIFCVDFRKLTDYAAPSVAIVCSLGKLACVFAGCCAGPKDPHGLFFPNLGYKALPIQLYETLFYAGIFVLVLVLMFTFSKKHEGYLMPITGILYSSFKAFAEGYRTWHCEWEQDFMNTGHTYWFYFELFQLGVCIIWLIGTIICEKTGKMPKFETNFLKRKLVPAFEPLKENVSNSFNEMKENISSSTKKKPNSKNKPSNSSNKKKKKKKK
jgi:hypothetical protein